MITYEKITNQEAEAFFDLMKQLDQETEYMLYLPDERQKDLEQTVTRINHLQKKGLLIGAKNNQKQLVGYLCAERSSLAKVSHSVYLVVGILADYQKMGIGTIFFKILEKWAKEQKVHRLELTVMTENQAAVSLYKKMGFAVEGTKQDAIFMNNHFLNEYYMAKLI